MKRFGAVTLVIAGFIAGITFTYNCGGSSSSAADTSVLEASIAALEVDLSNCIDRINDLETQLTDTQAKLAYLVVDDTSTIEGLAPPHVIFTGANLHVQNGSAQTDTNNGLGNLIVGYNEGSAIDTTQRTGSHNLVIGPQHRYTSFGGLVVGSLNTITGQYSSISGGSNNMASGYSSNVSGGDQNSASGQLSSISGGQNNAAIGTWSSVSGGRNNTASGRYSSISGGALNTASNDCSSVSGGNFNTASGSSGSISGGVYNLAQGGLTSVSGGSYNKAYGYKSSVSGGENNQASGNNSTVGGGHSRTVTTEWDWQGGGLFRGTKREITEDFLLHNINLIELGVINNLNWYTLVHI